MCQLSMELVLLHRHPCFNECPGFGFPQFTLQDTVTHVGALAVVCVVLCLSALLLVCLPWLATMRRCGGALALFVWGTLYTTAMVFVFTGGPVTAWEQVRRRRWLNLKEYDGCFEVVD